MADSSAYETSEESSSCFGCGAVVAGKLSREHVLPIWLHPYIAMDDVKLFVSEVKDGKESPSRQQVIHNFVNRTVCVFCNSGWMSKLETEVAPILIELILSKRRISSLTSQEKLVLARWAYKTGFMILGAQRTISAPWDKFSGWAKSGAGLLPEHTFVFGMSLKPPHSSHRSFGFTINDELSDEAERTNIRIGILLQALVLLLILPVNMTKQEFGIEDSGVRVLFPADARMYRLPRTELDPPTSFKEFLYDLTERVRIGCRATSSFADPAPRD